MRTAIDECVRKAKESKRLSIVIIGSTAKDGNPPFLRGPARESERFVACYFIVSQLKYVREIGSYADGKVDYIFIDSEAKTAESGDFVATLQSSVLHSKIKGYKGNDITALACDLLIHELVPLLSGRKVSIIGAGNLGSKLALTLAERGAHVSISRRDDKGELISQALNAMMPRYSQGRVYSEKNLALCVKDASVLVGFTQGFPVIGEAEVRSLAKQAIIVDGGIGTVMGEGIAAARELGLTIIRLDVRIAFSYVIDAILNTYAFIKEVAGTRTIDGKSYVAGGVIGKEGDIVVGDIRNLHEIIGIADGKGGINPLSPNE